MLGLTARYLQDFSEEECVKIELDAKLRFKIGLKNIFSLLIRIAELNMKQEKNILKVVTCLPLWFELDDVSYFLVALHLEVGSMFFLEKIFCYIILFSLHQFYLHGGS